MSSFHPFLRFPLAHLLAQMKNSIKPRPCLITRPCSQTPQLRAFSFGTKLWLYSFLEPPPPSSFFLSPSVPHVSSKVPSAVQAQDQQMPPAVCSTSCNVHVWLLVWARSLCLFVGEPLSFWVAQCVWTGVPPGRHTQFGSPKVLWHRRHPFFSDTTIGPPRHFIWTGQRAEILRKIA